MITIVSIIIPPVFRDCSSLCIYAGGEGELRRKRLVGIDLNSAVTIRNYEAEDI